MKRKQCIPALREREIIQDAGGETHLRENLGCNHIDGYSFRKGA